MDEEHTKKQLHLMLLIGIAMLIAIGWEILSGGRSAVHFHTENDAMTLTGPEETTITIPYDSILKISLVDDFDPGTAAGGGTKGNVRYGTWSNTLCGTYEAFLYTNIDSAIVIYTEDAVTAFNYENKDTTEELAKALADFSSDS